MRLLLKQPFSIRTLCNLPTTMHSSLVPGLRSRNSIRAHTVKEYVALVPYSRDCRASWLTSKECKLSSGKMHPERWSKKVRDKIIECSVYSEDESQSTLVIGRARLRGKVSSNQAWCYYLQMMLGQQLIAAQYQLRVYWAVGKVICEYMYSPVFLALCML